MTDVKTTIQKMIQTKRRRRPRVSSDPFQLCGLIVQRHNLGAKDPGSSQPAAVRNSATENAGSKQTTASLHVDP
jgi:hypothetical protein